MEDLTNSFNSALIQLITLIVTSIAVIATIVALWFTVNQFKKQLRLNFFSEYTKRYQEIMLHFPESINEPDFDLNNLEKGQRDLTMRYMRAYLDLCSEEYYLSQHKNIDKKIWLEWKSGIEYAFSKKAFQDSWNIISLDTVYYKEFSSFINNVILRTK